MRDGVADLAGHEWVRHGRVRTSALAASMERRYMALQRSYCNALRTSPTCASRAFGLKWVALCAPLNPSPAPPNGVSVAEARLRRAAVVTLIFLENPVSEHIAHVSDDQFEAQVLKSSEPVLVDFWAEWCGPCKMIAPLLDDLAATYQGKLKIAKINIDHNQKTPRNYNVRGIPTLMIFKDGKVEATQIGAVSKTQLAQMIDKAIA
jgi:thioredoxin 1